MKRIIATVGTLLPCFVFSLLSFVCYGQVQNEEGFISSTIAEYTSHGFEIYWISDNAGERKNDISRFPGVTDEIIKELNLADGAPSSMSAFLIKVDGQNLLFDAGMGSPSSLLISSLATIEVAPENVNYIFITHLHGDHIGGISKDGKTVFPNATIYISKQEYEKMNGEKILEPYKGKIVQFDFGDELICGIKAIDAIGHTPGHTCYLKDDVLIAGDIMHAVALQIVHPEFCAVYDKDPKMSIDTRIRIINMAKENKLLLCGMHFPKGGVIDYRK